MNACRLQGKQAISTRGMALLYPFNDPKIAHGAITKRF
jgi:hypothetical protein